MGKGGTITPISPTADGIPASRRPIVVSSKVSNIPKRFQEITRRLSRRQLLENDVVSMSIRELQPLKLVSSCSVTIKHARPAEASRARVSVGIFLLYLAPAITSAPLFDGSIDAELVTDDIGTVVKKNASFAPAYFLETGFLNAYVEAMNNNATAVSW
ncbi:hypothetical protein GN244_ATG15508 [Phytophthora infestans]|uniref:Uncharacterized protein n=1 Tax=Phytophthora infestans TaxID=4787 RepID=A0A833T2F2_PHYIN|nr:hypothetical protein GN244_ATG15508 [Phytophthora infestans]KAF4142330.1 hypothetical protein GN958_ATG08506 [Phytophthora infestans]